MRKSQPTARRPRESDASSHLGAEGPARAEHGARAPEMAPRRSETRDSLRHAQGATVSQAPAKASGAPEERGARREWDEQPETRGEIAGFGDEDDRFSAPPIRAKSRDHHEIHGMTPTLDDPHRVEHHHPSDNPAIEFGVDPEYGDAAGDLATDLGAQFLEGATLGEDMSERAIVDADRDEELPFLVEGGLDEAFDEDLIEPGLERSPPSEDVEDRAQEHAPPRRSSMPPASSARPLKGKGAAGSAITHERKRGRGGRG